MELVLVAGFLLIAVAGWVYFQYSETRRDLALEQLARRLGMNFRFGLPHDLKDVLRRFRAIEKVEDAGGDLHAGINSITGIWRDRKIAFFDYQWTIARTIPLGMRRSDFLSLTDDGRYRRTHVRSAVAVQTGLSLQPVLIRPERLVDKALALVGYDDIDFDFLPEFSAAFYVNSPDRVAARRLVTPALARFFLEHVRVSVDFVGPWILMTVDRVLPSDEVQDLMELAGRLSERVRQDHAHSR